MTRPMIEQMIEHFDLISLPVEGGLYQQTYRSQAVLSAASLPAPYTTDKPAGTAIIFLYTPDEDSFSAMHKLPTDEVYHFYLGDPVQMLLLHPDGRSEQVTLGHDIMAGQHVQFVVPAGTWQGSVMIPGGISALIGMTMAPGFTYTDYVGVDRAQLITQYPHEAALITRLTRLETPKKMPEGTK